MNKKQFLTFCMMSIFAGMAIGLGAAASLLANSLLPGLGGKLSGGVLFSVGMFVIITYNMNLFTGMVARIPTMGAKNYYLLPVCFVCNAVGIGIIALLARFSFSGTEFVVQAKSLMEAKLNADDWALRSFCSAFLCGLLITFSVRSADTAPKKNLCATVGVMFPIIVFAFCGFDHSVADMLYFYYFGEFSWRVAGYELLVILGNIAGGILFPLCLYFKDYLEKERKGTNLKE